VSRVRDYRQLRARLEALPARAWRVRRVATIVDYPWFIVERGTSRRAPTVMR
jgi:hypothetical protein